MKYTKITVSGKVCTGKTTLFTVLQKKLCWLSFSTGNYFRIRAKKKHTALETADEQNDRITKEVDFRVQKMLKDKSHRIVEGWAAGIMALDNPSVLRVLLVTDDAKRFERFAHREHITQKEAATRVTKRETNWLKKLKSIHHRDDFFDPKNYNLVIDTTNKTPSQILAIVFKKIDNLSS